MSESRKPDHQWEKPTVALLASLSILPIWYPFFERSLMQRANILKSKKPNDLSHTTLFSQKRNYYRGFTANVVSMQWLFPATEWLLDVTLQKIEQIQKRNPSLAEKFVSGFITGSATALIANPYEAANISAQTNKITPAKAFLNILCESGPKGFYRGFLPMALRNGGFVSGLMVTTPALTKKLDELIVSTDFKHHLAKTSLAAVIPTTIYTSMAIPFDLAAVMRQTDPSQKVVLSGFNALKQAYTKHGIAAVKAGTALRLLSGYIEMIGYNLFKEHYQKQLESNSTKKRLSR